MIPDTPLLNVFYGDDFTGTMSTAEVFTGHGVPTLVVTAPQMLAAVRRRFSRVRAVGLAGTARTETTAALEGLLPPIFRLMRDCRPATLLYKVCSTFDSAVEIGNIGRAIEIALEELPNRYAALLPAAPQFGRFVIFGNLFATAGGQEVHRLDRHPSMSKHPVTPMDEADLLRHLARQTDLPGAVVDIRCLRRGRAAVREEIQLRCRQGKKVVLFDCLETEDMLTACSAVLEEAAGGNPPLFVGSHELPGGIAGWFAGQEQRTAPPSREAATKPGAHCGPGAQNGPIFCVSGSCAPVTGGQVQWGVANGFAGIAARPERFLDPEASEKEQTRIVSRASAHLRSGKSVLVHTAIGPADGRIHAVGAQAAGLGVPTRFVNKAIGDALGGIARAVLDASPVRRVVVFGGDTSGAVLSQLKIAGLQVAARLAGTPAPLCFAYSDDPGMNGLEIALKGGQVGGVDYLGAVGRIRLPDFREVGLEQSSATG